MRNCRRVNHVVYSTRVHSWVRRFGAKLQSRTVYTFSDTHHGVSLTTDKSIGFSMLRLGFYRMIDEGK